MQEDAILYSCEIDPAELERFWAHLYDSQTEREKLEGDSIVRNGVGLTCFEARAARGGRADADEKLRMVRNHLGQLSRAVEGGELEAARHERPRGADMARFFAKWGKGDPETVAKRRRRRASNKHRLGESDSETSDGDAPGRDARRLERRRGTSSKADSGKTGGGEASKRSSEDSGPARSKSEDSGAMGSESSEEEGGRRARGAGTTVTAAGLYHEPSRTIVLLNRRAHETVVRTALESPSFAKALAGVRAKLEWAFPVTANDVDAALFQELRAKRVAKGSRVRMFWEDAGAWVGATVLRMNEEARKFELRFDDGTTGSASMHDAEMMYASPWR